MVRVYISGKIRGTDDYLERFANAEIRLKASGLDAINPTKLSAAFPTLSDEEYIKVDLALLETCTMVYALRGWETSAGARMEIQRAKEAGIAVFYEDGIRALCKEE